MLVVRGVFGAYDWIRIVEVITGFIMSSVGALFSVLAYRIIFYRNEDKYI